MQNVRPTPTWGRFQPLVLSQDFVHPVLLYRRERMTLQTVDWWPVTDDRRQTIARRLTSDGLCVCEWLRTIFQLGTSGRQRHFNSIALLLLLLLEVVKFAIIVPEMTYYFPFFAVCNSVSDWRYQILSQELGINATLKVDARRYSFSR